MTELGLVVRTRGPRFWLPIAVFAAIALSFLFTPAPMLEKLRVLSAGVCAQRVGHSILFGGVQPPLESRMIGIYGGFMVTLLMVAGMGRWRSVMLPSMPLLILALLFIAMMGFDGTNALFYDIGLPHAYAPDNTIRLITGTLSGFGVAMLVLPVVNYSLWRNQDTRPMFDVRSFSLTLGVLAVFVAVILTGAGLLLYPVSILSVAGVAILVLAINLLIVLAASRREGRVESFADLTGPVAVALPLALLELLVLAGLRIWAETTLGITPL